MKGNNIVLALATVVAQASGLSAHAERDPATFYWKGDGNYRSFADPARWGVGTTSSATNPDNLIPAEYDMLAYGPATMAFDMGGLDFQVKGLDTSTFTGYDKRFLYVQNGSLTFLSAFPNNCFVVTIPASGTLTFGPDCASSFGKGGMVNSYEVSGALNMGGQMTFQYLRATVKNGARMTFEPAGKIQIPSGLFNEVGVSYFDNSGTLSIPNGFVFEKGGNASKTAASFEIRQNAGTLSLGGSLVKESACHYNISLLISGGSLSVTDDVAFEGLTAVSVASGMSLPIEVAEAKTFDASNMTFGEGVSLTKTGSGSILLGAAAPDVLNIAEGSLAVKQTVFKALTLGAEVKVVDAADRDEQALAFGSQDVLAALKDKLEDSQGRTYVIVNGALYRESVRGACTFFWKGDGNFRPFLTPSWWGVGTDSSATNPNNWIPGYADTLAFKSATSAFDMGGQSCQIQGFAEYVGWDARPVYVENGSLTFLTTFPNNGYNVTIQSSGRLAFGPDCVSVFGKGGVANIYDVSGVLDLGGRITFQYLKATVRSGGVMTLDPNGNIQVPATLFNEVGTSFIDNSGSLSIPGGFVFEKGGNASKPAASFEIRQKAGTLSLGGPLVRESACHYNVSMLVSGGILKATGDVSFKGLLTVSVAENLALPVVVTDGKTLDVGAMTFGTGSSVSKSGTGTLTLGINRPETVTISEGAVSYSEAGDIGEGLVLSPGSVLHLSVPGLSAESIEGIDDPTVGVTLADSLKKSRTVLFCSSNETLLEKIREKLPLPEEGYRYDIAGGKLTYRRDSGLVLIFR